MEVTLLLPALAPTVKLGERMSLTPDPVPGDLWMELQSQTGASVTQCIQALAATNLDMKAAMERLTSAGRS